MQNFTVTDRERDTVLAALRYYQFYRMQGHPFDPRQDHLIDTIAGQTDTVTKRALCTTQKRSHPLDQSTHLISLQFHTAILSFAVKMVWTSLSIR